MLWVEESALTVPVRLAAVALPTAAELAHNVRTRRSKRELIEGNRYVIPNVEWEQSLDPSVDSAMISAIGQLEQLGVKFSKTTKMSLVNRRYETEMEQVVSESKYEQELMQKHPEMQMALGGGGAEGGGMPGGGGVLPGLPPESLGMEPMPEGGEMPPPLPGEGGGEMGAPPEAAEGDGTEGHGGSVWDSDGRYGAWTRSDVRALFNLMEGDVPEEPWENMETTQAGREALVELREGDLNSAWPHLQDWMYLVGYPTKDVNDLEDILKSEGQLRQAARADAAYDTADAHGMSKDSDADNWLSGVT